MKRLIILLLFPMMLSLYAQDQSVLSPGLYARFNTEQGSMLFELYPQDAPLAVLTFVGLSEGTLGSDDSPYYNNLTFYRVIEGYALLSGDPDNTGEGNPGYSFPRETQDLLDLAEPGILALQGFPLVSQAGQFFITISGDGYLNRVYTPFGKILEGQAILGKIAQDDELRIEILRIGPEAEAYSATEEDYIAALTKAKEKELGMLQESNPQLAATIASLPDYQQTPTGIYYHIRYEGYGDTPSPGNRVAVHYTGSLLDGTVFDSSLQRGAPFELEVGTDPVIAGWVETLMDMQPGENRVVIIPPELGYGSRGAGGVIPPDSWLIFEIQLLSVE